MDLQTKAVFNTRPSQVMHVDLNSCFASVEQQANFLLRNKPIAVAAYDSPNGCILAPSVEAKRYGIKTGMRIKDAKKLFSNLIILTSDPDKYRAVHLAFKKLLSSYTPSVSPRSIDEFVLDFSSTSLSGQDLHRTAIEIKSRIKKEIGDYLTVSVGIGPNRFLAKTASNLHKPDGLDEINHNNYLEVYEKLSLTDLTGISYQNSSRLNNAGIFTVLDFFHSDILKLKSAFHSIIGYYWFLRLHGWEIDEIDWKTKSIGHSYSPPKFFTKTDDLAPILSKLVEKVGYRMRTSGYASRGISIAVLYKDHEYWRLSKTLSGSVFSSQDIYQVAYRMLCRSPYHLPVRNLAISCFDLEKSNSLQLDLFTDNLKKKSTNDALDKINAKWGQFTITPATMSNTADFAHDSIGFGNIRGLAQN